MNLIDSTLPRRSLLAMLPAVLSACSAVDLLNATVPDDTYLRVKGRAYGPDPRQRLDIYQPKNLSPANAKQTSMAAAGPRASALIIALWARHWLLRA